MNTKQQESFIKILVQFSIPLILSGLLQQLYTWTDTFILGNAEGETALAAAGATTAISEFLTLLILGFSIGLSIMTAQTYGNGNREEIPKILSCFVLLLGGFFLIVGIACMVGTPQLLQLVSTPENVAEDATRYVRIIFLGMPFVAVYNVYFAVLRGVGNSRLPFFTVAVSVIANGILDVLFVVYFHMGVTGAAFATVLAQLFLAVFVVLYTSGKYPGLRLRLSCDSESKKENRKIISDGLRLGIPTALQSGITAFGNILLQQFLNGFGTQVVAAITVAYRIDSIIMLPISNLGSAVSTMVAQNIGMKNEKDARNVFFAGAVLMLATTLVLSIFTAKASGFLISMFQVTGETAEFGAEFFSIITKFYVVYGIAIVTKSYLEGRGDVSFAAVANLLALGARICLSYLLKDRLGSGVIAYAESFSWILLLVICAVRSRTFFRVFRPDVRQDRYI